MKKIYVLDTNILISDPRAVFGFDDNDVIVTQTTLQELDKKKSAPGETGFNAREAIRVIESLRTRAKDADITNPIKLDNGGTFVVVPDDVGLLPASYSKESPDNRIIGTILHLYKENPKKSVILVTNDVSMRIVASAAHIKMVEAYRNDHVDEADKKYSGLTIVKNYSQTKLNKYKKTIGGTKFTEAAEIKEFGHVLEENEYVSFEKDDYWEGVDMAIKKNGYLNMIPDSKESIFGVIPKNSAQKAALYALTAQCSDIPLVILRGPAGCAKTFLSLAAGLSEAMNHTYNRVLITRANVLADNEFGFLPGDLNEKMGPLLAPFMDNLTNLIKNQEPKESIEVINTQIADMFESGLIDICAMAYMRGRSITNSYLIVDEAQNASRSQIRDIITRAGIGTKIVLLGDESQIDRTGLDSLNNGLVFAAQRFKGSPLCAQITFDSEMCVRSDLAKAGIDILKI